MITLKVDKEPNTNAREPQTRNSLNKVEFRINKVKKRDNHDIGYYTKPSEIHSTGTDAEESSIPYSFSNLTLIPAQSTASPQQFQKSISFKSSASINKEFGISNANRSNIPSIRNTEHESTLRHRNEVIHKRHQYGTFHTTPFPNVYLMMPHQTKPDGNAFDRNRHLRRENASSIQ